VPGWCASAAVSVNGKSLTVAAEAGKYLRLQRQWKEGDLVVLKLPMQVSVRHWAANHDSVSVDYGPLAFSLKSASAMWKRTARTRPWAIPAGRPPQIHPNGHLLRSAPRLPGITRWC